jgi:1,4-alpha-glucan branching enzyme
MNRVYRAMPALWSRDTTPEGFSWIDANDSSGNVLSFLRNGVDADGKPTVMACIANFSGNPKPNYRVGLPFAGRWREVLNTDAESYGGSGWGNYGGVDAEQQVWHGRPASAVLQLPPAGVLWFAPEPFEGAVRRSSVAAEPAPAPADVPPAGAGAASAPAAAQAPAAEPTPAPGPAGDAPPTGPIAGTPQAESVYDAPEAGPDAESITDPTLASASPMVAAPGEAVSLAPADAASASATPSPATPDAASQAPADATVDRPPTVTETPGLADATATAPADVSPLTEVAEAADLPAPIEAADPVTEVPADPAPPTDADDLTAPTARLAAEPAVSGPAADDERTVSIPAGWGGDVEDAHWEEDSEEATVHIALPTDDGPATDEVVAQTDGDATGTAEVSSDDADEGPAGTAHRNSTAQ